MPNFFSFSHFACYTRSLSGAFDQAERRSNAESKRRPEFIEGGGAKPWSNLFESREANRSLSAVLSLSKGGAKP